MVFLDLFEFFLFSASFPMTQLLEIREYLTQYLTNCMHTSKYLLHSEMLVVKDSCFHKIANIVFFNVICWDFIFF